MPWLDILSDGYIMPKGVIVDTDTRTREMNEDLQALRERLLKLAVEAYDKGLTHGKRDPIELAELYMKYVTGVLAE